ncbi:MAG: LysR family transcriptional regulator, partial [Deltaproteobacteria bacterium]|nr:LysR family transcriptional regulator [Deltaproteobacteria bacterium]
MANEQPRGLLRLTAPYELGSAFLTDIVSEFLAAHPEVDIELELTERPVDLVEEGFDLSFKSGRVSDSSLIARELGLVQAHLVASPEYLARRGTPSRPEELEQHDLVVAGR